MNTRKEQYQNTIKMYKNKISAHNSWIKKKSKEIETKEAKLQLIHSYKVRKSNCKKLGKGRKPVFTKVLKKLQASKLKCEVAALKKKIGHKKTRIDTLEKRLRKAERRLEKKSLCFGGEKLLKKQHNLSKTEFDSHEEWVAF